MKSLDTGREPGTPSAALTEGQLRALAYLRRVLADGPAKVDYDALAKAAGYKDRSITAVLTLFVSGEFIKRVGIRTYELLEAGRDEGAIEARVHIPTPHNIPFFLRETYKAIKPYAQDKAPIPYEKTAHALGMAIGTFRSYLSKLSDWNAVHRIAERTYALGAAPRRPMACEAHTPAAPNAVEEPRFTETGLRLPSRREMMAGSARVARAA